MPSGTINPYNLVFTPASLSDAVHALFSLNDYKVIGPLKIAGAEIDLMALQKRDLFPQPIYIEVTTAFVDNTKYGKDCTKFITVLQNNPKCRCLIVSSAGFTPDVKERAKAANIETLTYSELLSGFEQFSEYLSSIFIDGPLHQDLKVLRETYEEPNLRDDHGVDNALTFLREWRDKEDTGGRWLIIVGEYGTGKTALTKVLQYDWCFDYASNTTKPIVFRMELRDFARQFDADSLLHFVLDKNHLGNIPIPYIHQLIRSGRIILLLDGYDEMAQYMNTRERRACLEALAMLSREGARGILTSRPNYFSEAEELTVLDVLYKELTAAASYATSDLQKFADRERDVDSLLESHFVDRFERTLQDLTPDQTAAFVRRKLANNVDGQQVVLDILNGIFRDEGSSTLALSGKPVIITYLLEVVDTLLADQDEIHPDLTEWSVYQLIVNKLMLRDFQRTKELMPDQRRRFLWSLAVALSKRDNPTIDEEDFRQLIGRDIKARPSLSEEERQKLIGDRFNDLRASTTLTRSGHGSGIGWRFSHNSLREYLLTEYCLEALGNEHLQMERGLPITGAMRTFAAAQPRNDLSEQVTRLAKRWNEDASSRSTWLSLLWNHLTRDANLDKTSVANSISSVSGGRRIGAGTILSRLAFSRIDAPQDLTTFELSETEFMNVSFEGANLRGSSFVGSWIDSCSFHVADLEGCNFTKTALNDVRLSGANLKDAVFIAIEGGSSILVPGEGMVLESLTGAAMIGYLRFRGAHTDAIGDYWVYRHDSRFSIIEKISRKLTEQATRQRRGLIKRGAAVADTGFAARFVESLIAAGYVESPKGRKDLITATARGRDEFGKFAEGNGYLPDAIRDFMKASPTIA